MNCIEHRDPAKFERICAAFKAGATIRQVMVSEKIAKATSMTHRQLVYMMLEDDGLPPPRCGCGRPAGHKGCCRYYFRMTPARVTQWENCMNRRGRQRKSA